MLHKNQSREFHHYDIARSDGHAFELTAEQIKENKKPKYGNRLLFSTLEQHHSPVTRLVRDDAFRKIRADAERAIKTRLVRRRKRMT